MATPFSLAFQTQSQAPSCGSLNPHIYVDSIKTSRDGPNEFEAKNQVAIWFTPMLFWWSTINKKADWVNNICYNQQKIVNHTLDVMQKIVKHLSALTAELAESSRIGNPFPSLTEQWLGKQGEMMTPIIILLIIFGKIILVGCGLILRVKALVQGQTETVLTEQSSMAYQNNLLLNTFESKSHCMLMGFEEKSNNV